MYFPTLCVDNFFDNPKEVVDLAYSLPRYPAGAGGWPGERTFPLCMGAPEYNNFFNKKLFSLFYDLEKDNVSWEVDSYFQFTTPYGDTPEVNSGWVHADASRVLAGVVYLNERPDPAAGTSLFKRKRLGVEQIHTEYKRKYYLDKNSIDEATYLNKLKENNDLFEETLNVSNVYNRLVCYDGSQFHKANGFSCGGEPRLTQVFFVKKVNADRLPIPYMRSI